jgi:uncharacterized membrane protein
MKAYVVTTAIAFGLLTAAHIWRLFVERHLSLDPLFIVATVIAAAFTIWAVILLRRS